MQGQGWGGGCLSLAMGAVGTTGLQAALLLERVCSGLSMAQTRNKSALDLWSKASPGRGDSRDREGADAQEQPSHEAQCSPSMLHPTSTSLAPRSGQTDRWTWWPPPALMPSLRGTAGCQPWERSTYGAMYSVEITVEKDKVTGETKVLSSTTLLPQNHCVQGIKVYEDELKVVHAVSAEDGALQNGAQPLSSSEVDELLHKADEVTLGEATVSGEAPGSATSSQKATPRREITGLQAKPRENSTEGTEPSREQPVTMIFMGYQNVEDENETKKVLGLEGTIKAELVVIEDAESKPEPASQDHAPPNGTALEPAAAPMQGDEVPGGQKVDTNAMEAKEAEPDMDAKKQRCKCCTVM